MNEKLGTELHPDDQRAVLDAYPYRMTHESVKRWPQAKAQMIQGGYRLPLVSDAEWLGLTYFAVTKAGRLNRAVQWCRTIRGNPGLSRKHDLKNSF